VKAAYLLPSAGYVSLNDAAAKVVIRLDLVNSGVGAVEAIAVFCKPVTNTSRHAGEINS
jgi:hypothetical protein